MATSLVFKVRDGAGVLVASTKLIGDAVIVAARHGKGTKISHMHVGVLATVDDSVMSACTIDSLRTHAIATLAEKREARRAEYERKYGRPA